MANPRKLTLVEAEASGATRDRERYKNRKSPAESPKLGGPSVGLDPQECEIWQQTIEYMWWLREHHRHMFELYVRLIARMHEGDTSSEVVSGILRCSSKLGGDPVADQMFGSDDGKESDEYLDR